MPFEDQIDILGQLKRIAGKIVIIEDTPGNYFEWIVNAIGDAFANVPKGIRMCYTYRSANEWLEVFRSMGFRPRITKRIARWYPIHRTMFIIDCAQEC